MKLTLPASLVAPVLALPLTALGQPVASPKIALTPEMVVNESGQADAGLLVDEQEKAGDPRDGEGGQPETVWYQKQRKVYYPLSVFIDLGAVHRLTDVYLYDTNGKMDVTVESGEPFNWRPLFTEDLGAYKTWKRHEVDVETRYLRVEVPHDGAGMPEIVLYGTPTEPVQKFEAPEPQAHPLPTMDDLIGTNAFIDDPLEMMQVAGYVREYHNWSWDAGPEPYPNNVYAFQPSFAGGGGWFFDDYYRRLKEAGVMVAPSLKQVPKWISEHHNHNPVDPGDTDWADPASYEAHADYMFQFAARYGGTSVSDDKLKLAPGQPRVSGLGLIQWFENGNEPNAWWEGRHAYSTPYELAAQSSADYDGHRGALGDTVGVKNADPDAKMAMGGLAGLELDYIKAMKVWADWNRGGDFPADAINVHTYSNDIGGQGNSRRGISPEDDRLREKLEEIVDYRNRYLRGREVWLTEFGYDTHPQATEQAAPAIGDDGPEEVQARWLLRSYLEIAAAGVDRAAQYMLRDAGAGTGKYGTSGLTSPKGEWERKPSWYYTYTLRNRLAGMRFDGDVDSGRDDVRVYRFRHEDGRGAYVLWAPTSRDLTVEGYRFDDLGPATEATLVDFVNGDVDGEATTLPIDGGAVTLDVTERPVILLVDRLPG